MLKIQLTLIISTQLVNLQSIKMLNSEHTWWTQKKRLNCAKRNGVQTGLPQILMMKNQKSSKRLNQNQKKNRKKQSSKITVKMISSKCSNVKLTLKLRPKIRMCCNQISSNKKCDKQNRCLIKVRKRKKKPQRKRKPRYSNKSISVRWNFRIQALIIEIVRWF